MTNHPAKLVSDDEYDYVDNLGRQAQEWCDNPPEAPPGFELIECHHEPRHFPRYTIADCEYVETLRSELDVLRHKGHSRFLRTKAGRWLVNHAYSLGIISGSAWSSCVSGGGCITAIYWRGRRPYILGWPADNWRCLLKYHHWPTADKILGGMCTKCLPCDVCGSTEAWHRCQS